MKSTFHDIKQKDEYLQPNSEWMELRLGRVTASKLDKLITKTGKISQAEGVDTLIYELVAEEERGQPHESFETAAMQHGNTYEDEARKEYERITKTQVEHGGFYTLDDLPFGASPDGRIFNNGELEGLIEIKCPYNPANQIETLDKGILPAKHKQQVQGQLLATGAKWVDFFSYYQGLSHFLIRVERDEEYIATIIEALERVKQKKEDVHSNIAPF